MKKTIESFINKINPLINKKEVIEYIEDEDYHINGSIYFDYNGDEYWMFAGMDNYNCSTSALFDPTIFNMFPINHCVDDYDGHYCRFDIKDKLYLEKLKIRCFEPKPSLFGKKYVMDTKGYANYGNLNHVVNFTGSGYFGFGKNRNYVFSDRGVLLFYPAWCFEKVIELQFSRGELLNIVDHSDRMRRIRELLPKDTESVEYLKLSTKPYLEELLTNYDIKYLGELHWIIETGRSKSLYLEQLRRLEPNSKVSRRREYL